jgi:uncharacterized protein with von Willebrand factor type A (vWA) domain
VVAATGYADRDLLRDSLCVALAKSASEVELFDHCFDTFFARETFAPMSAGESGDEESPLASMILAGDGAGLAQSMELAAHRVETTRIRTTTQRRPFTRRILDQMGIDAVERRIAELLRSGDEADAALAERLAEGRRRLMEEASRFVDRQFDLYAKEAGRQTREELLADKAMTGERIDPDDFQMMKTLVRRMAKRLASKYSRRAKRARRGVLDVRRTVRKSMGYGGAPFDLVWKTKTIDKPKLVVLCDVSKSVAAAAQFLLLFLYSLNEVVEEMHAFAFSGRLVPVGDILDAESVERAIQSVLDRIGYQQTDYGRALDDFCAQHLGEIDRRTTVFILGDARSNHSEPRLELMRAIQKRARAVIWLNPEPESFWGSGDSVMKVYARFTTVAKHCATLRQLDRIIEDVLRVYLPH